MINASSPAKRPHFYLERAPCHYWYAYMGIVMGWPVFNVYTPWLNVGYAWEPEHD